MRRKKDSDLFLPITLCVCFVLAVGGYLGLKKKDRVTHKQPANTTLESPQNNKSLDSDDNLKSKPEEKDMLVDFKYDVLYSKHVKNNKEIDAQRDVNRLTLTYKKNFFRRSSYELYPSAMKRLKKMIPIMKKHGNVLVDIYGHTDATPILKRKYRKWNTREKLSELRANAVKRLLVKNGINPLHITVNHGYDTYKQNKTKLDRAVTLTFGPAPKSATLAGVGR